MGFSKLSLNAYQHFLIHELNMTSFKIPAEFQTDLEVIDDPDQRTDKEILNSLRNYVPVTSEKNVWAFWHAGVDAMPDWSRRNVLDWVRILGDDWTVRVIDTIPESPNYALKFAPRDMLPKAFLEGTMTGPYTKPHSADFLRGALLYTHGGVSMDVGCILVRHLDRVCWEKLENPESPYEVAVPLMYGQVMANHFVAARKENPFIKKWHDLFTHLWENRTDYAGLSANPLLAFLSNYQFAETEAQNFHWDYKVPVTQVMDYVAQVACWKRLCLLEDTGDGFSGCDYWRDHIFAWSVAEENWPFETLVGYKGTGEKTYDLLQVRLDADPQSEAYREAYELVWRTLSGSSMQKLSHGKGLTHSVHLAVLWDENPGKDRVPGTFGELLRYGTVHFRQKRESIVQMETPRPSGTMKKGLLEP